MSEFIATARVKVEPDTKGFERALREKLKPILAKPFGVSIVPVTKGFQGAIRTALRDLKAVPVPIIPTKLEAFRAAIAAQSVPIEVPVIVDPAALKAQLVAAVAFAESGVAATIPVAFAGGGGAADVNALNAALAGLATQMEKLAKAQTAATKGGKAREKTEASLTTVEKLRVKANEAVAASELALTDANNINLDLETRRDAATTAGTEIKSAYGAATKLVALEENEANRALRESVAATQLAVSTSKERIKAAAEAAAVGKSAIRIEEKTKALIAELNALRQVSVKTINSETTAKARANTASTIATKLRTQEAAAIKAELPLLAEQAALAQAGAAAYAKAAREQSRAIVQTAKQAEKAREIQIAQGKTATGQLNFARRGAAATALSLLGIRGATLASTGAFLAGAAAASIFALSVKSAVSLEQELNVFQVTAHATAEEMDRVRAISEELGRDIRLPGISAADAAVAMTSLAKAGLSVQDSIAGATGVLQLSIAANIDLARSTEIVASAINAFGLAGEDAIHVADVLANSANLAQGSIDDMGIAMAQAAAVGRQAGLSFEDTATFLTILARAGLRGSDAGTSLRTGLIRLINPTEKAQKILDKLGVSIRDAEGNIRPEVFQNLAAATAGMTKAQRDQTIAQLAGNDAVRAFSIIMRLTTPELVKFRQENRKAGAAAALTEARAKGLAGSARGLASNLQTTGIAIGRYATPALQSLVSGMNSAVLTMSSSEQVRNGFKSFFQSLGDIWSATAATARTLAPAFQLVGNAAAQAIGFIGATPILAGIAAWKLLGPAVYGVAGAFNALRVAAYGSFLIFQDFQAKGLGRAAAGMATFRSVLLSAATSATVWTAAITAASVAVAYLLTRETDLEKAQKSLQTSTDALSQSMSAYRTAADAAASATSSVETNRLARDSAALNVQLARAALSNSDAAKGSLERRQLENALAVAIDNSRQAQERLNEALKRAKESQDEAAVAERNRGRARAKANEDLQKFIDKEKERAALIAETGPAGAEKAYLILIKSVNQELDKRIIKLEEENTVASRDLAKRFEVIKNLQKEQNRLLEPREWEILLNADSVEQGLTRLAQHFGIKAGEATRNWIRGIKEGLKPFWPTLIESVLGPLNALAGQIEKIAAEQGAIYRRGFVHGIEESGGPVAPPPTAVVPATGILGRVAGLERQRQQARIAGATPQEEIGFLQQEKALIEARKARGHLTVAALKKLNDELESINSEIESLNNSITSAEEQAASDAQEAADKQKAAQDKRDQAFLDLLGRREQKLLNAQLRAGQTESLADDLRVNRNLRKLYKQQINKIKERVKDKETRNAAIRALQQKSIQLEVEFARLQKDAAEQQAQLVRERFELDIQFFQTTENRRGEINARKRFIAYLKKLRADTKAGSIEARRLRNEIAEQEQALKEAKAEEKKRRNAWAELTWEFMQTQQGFAANLLGNLIPLGASHNLVGNITTTGGGGGILGGGTGTTPGLPGSAGLPAGVLRGDQGGPPLVPGQRLLQAQGRAAGAAQPPMGRDQASVEIQLLQTIAGILARMERGARHPEARKAQVSQNSAYDTMPHGAAYEP